LLSRQNLPCQPRDPARIAGIARGGYVLADSAGPAQALIIATGSEVQLAVGAQQALAAQGIAVRVISMPSTTVFDRQDSGYREQVLPRALPRVAVEAGVSDYWRKYVGLDGAVVGIDRFGESAPAADVFKFLEVTAEHVVAAVTAVLSR
jgi:transketolase